MKICFIIKPNIIFYVGLIIIIINVKFFTLNLIVFALSTALIFFSETITKRIRGITIKNDCKN